MIPRTITLTPEGSRPDTLAHMVKGEAREITINTAVILNGNDLDALTLTASPSNLMIGTADLETGTVLLTATQSGCYTLTATATLDNGEIYKGLVALEVVEAEATSADYV